MDGSEIVVNLTLYPYDLEEVTIKQVAMGASPSITIEGVLGEAGEPELDVSASGLSQDELVGVLELLLYSLQNGEEV